LRGLNRKGKPPRLGEDVVDVCLSRMAPSNERPSPNDRTNAPLLKITSKQHEVGKLTMRTNPIDTVGRLDTGEEY